MEQLDWYYHKQHDGDTHVLGLRAPSLLKERVTPPLVPITDPKVLAYLNH